MNKDYHNLYVITGGPGTGKTTTLNQLKQDGFKCITEDAREIIKEQMATGGTSLPWKDKKNYTLLMLRKAYESYSNVLCADDNDIYFFDRSILDAVCYADMISFPVPQEFNHIIENCIYNKNVFIFPPWPEIYQTDTERKQNWQEALDTYNFLKATYQKFGYTLIEVPKDTPRNRAAFIKTHIQIVY
ncbi:hypothetical protein Pedsa_0534 [Pseudopedobacter saltans DSM 12145]|uniref:NadR/Ttd14 AAA domain-containing protein n=1 Tax=Pseudopedobacter saltans (strain ATCC 51119 / DSM 12145 / JCM 21818 / CCUG 39354 / LMG 10337 / NBRC 100064 / NCIMB 13643) TaxID=762903 RepID=F0S6N9_PSESL|nr:AAA family ATPase [Pseudopedobacter saltans]ADY51115.1 hypothetical protein Pedsa_0534 [Pseudopedobacter saltans DSM 12145]